jgi:hypothetical protein
MIAPADRVSGLAVVGCAVVLWGLLCGATARLAGSTLLFAVALFLPYFLVTPLIRLEVGADGWRGALLPPWSVFVHGVAGVQVSVWTATTLSASALRLGLMELPLPRIVAAIVLQIVQQSTTLISETRRVAAAISVRGGTARYRTAVRVVASATRVWLPRVVTRAERVALTMELRGYCERDLRRMGVATGSSADVAAVGLAILALAAAVALRVWGEVW